MGFKVERGLTDRSLHLRLLGVCINIAYLGFDPVLVLQTKIALFLLSEQLAIVNSGKTCGVFTPSCVLLSLGYFIKEKFYTVTSLYLEPQELHS